MAFRIDNAIVRGEITNEVPGIVTGRIWLFGRDKPLVLQLQGNCQSDLAGSTLTFENPSPSHQPIDGLATYQVGSAGEITASQKVRVPTVSDEELTRLIEAREPIPSRWANCLYLEWNSDANGRVVIQTEKFNLSLSEPRWLLPRDKPQPGPADSPFTLSQEDEDNDPFSNIGEEFLVESDEDFDADEPLDEFEWEQELRDADLRADAYHEALEKFHEHMDHKEILDHFTEGNSPEPKPESDAQLPLLSEKESADDLQHKHHDFTSRAMDLAFTIREEFRRHNVLHTGESNGQDETPGMKTMASTVQFGGRLAAALDGVANGADPEHGFIIAMLKRSLLPLNNAIGDCSNAITAHASIPALVAFLAEARIQLFDLRHDILDLMAELRSSDR